MLAPPPTTCTSETAESTFTFNITFIHKMQLSDNKDYYNMLPFYILLTGVSDVHCVYSGVVGCIYMFTPPTPHKTIPPVKSDHG